MKGVRVLIATAAVAALAATAAFVALAAPGAVRGAASPSAGAAHAVYCPAGEREARQAAVKRFQKAMKNARTKYVRYLKSQRKMKASKKKSLLAAYVRKQEAQLRTLERKLEACD